MADPKPALVFAAAAGMSVAAQGQSCFRVLDPEFVVYGLSADGRTVVGEYGTQAAICDSSTGEITLLPLPAATSSLARAASPDRRFVVGETEFGGVRVPVVWRDGIASYPEPPGHAPSGAAGVSADGMVVLGYATLGPNNMPSDQGYVWRTGSLRRLSLLPESEYAFGIGMTPDGRMIVGAATRAAYPAFYKAVTWTDEGPPVELIPEWVSSCAYASTPDGRVVVGMGNDGSWYIGGPFRWSAGFGATMLPCPTYSPYTEVMAESVSDNGMVIAMWAAGAEFESLLWTAAAGTRNVFDVLGRLGCTGPEWQLWNQGRFWVSADGQTLAGEAGENLGNGHSRNIPWIAVLPPELVCYANCDSSTEPPALNINDFICFQERFAAGDTYANCDESSTPPILNVNDFVCFLRAFAAGCG